MISVLASRITLSSLSLLGVLGVSDPTQIDLTVVGRAVQTAINWATGLAGTFALIYLIYGGIQYITSGGNSKQAETAKATITWSIIGLVVVIAAYAIVRYFTNLVIQ